MFTPTRLQRLSINPVPRRFLSNYFGSNLRSLFGRDDESDPKNSGKEGQAALKPSQKVVSIFRYYNQFTPKTKISKNEIQSQTKITRGLLSSTRHDHRISMRSRPEIGSLVEVQKSDGTVHFGVVNSTQRGLFNDELMSLSLVDIDKKTRKFRANEVSFHLLKLVKPEIAQNDLKKREISEFLKFFINSTKISRYNDAKLFSMTQAWLGSENTPTKVDLQRVSELVQRYSSQRKNDLNLDNEISYFAAHMQLCNDPVNWITMRTFSDLTASNDSLPQFSYYSNSFKTIEHLENAMKLKDSHLDKIADEINNMTQGGTKNQVEYMDSIIVLMKHYMAYPHRSLRRPLVTIMQRLKRSTSIEPELVNKTLIDAGIHSSVLSTVTPEEPQQELYSMLAPDHFQFLREPSPRIAYTLPNPDSQVSDLAFSIEKSTNYWDLEIHIADVASHLDPSSKLVEILYEKITSLKTIGVDISLFDDNVIQKLGFSETGQNDAITIGIRYPMDTMKSWEKSKLMFIGLTRLDNVKVVSLDELNDVNETESSLLSFFRSKPEQTTLDKNDRDGLMSLFQMIYSWKNARIANNALHTKIIKKKPLMNSDGEVELKEMPSSEELPRFLREELSYITSHFLIEYSIESNCPLLIHSKSTLPALQDSIEIKPNRFGLPVYEASEYENFTLFTNGDGEVTFKSFICSQHLLSPEVVSTDKELPFASLGLSRGVVEFINPLNDMESIVNQWQIVNSLKESFKSKNGYDYQLNQLVQNYNLLNDKDLIQLYDFKISPRKNFYQDFKARNERYWKVKWLSDHQPDWMIFKCVITKPNKYPNLLATAYCIELDLEVNILLSQELKQVQTGDQLICTKFVKLDYISSVIIFEA